MEKARESLGPSTTTHPLGGGGWEDLFLGCVARQLHPSRPRPRREGHPLTLVLDFIKNGSWDEPKPQLLHSQAGLSQQAIALILDTPIIPGEPDIPRWSLTRLGDFSIASTWETTRTQRPIIQGLDDIWKAGLTTSISIFIWRLLSNRILVDTKLQWRKMEMASKCQCCPHRPSIESLQHLFIQGVGATSVWKEFDSWFEGTSSPLRINDTIPERLEVWSQRTQQVGKKHLSRAMPYLILWFLWAERNRSRHQSVQFKPFNVVWQVQMFVRNSMVNGSIKPKHWKCVRLRIEIPNQVETRRPRPFAMPVKWYPPDQHWIKLNTDGAYIKATDKAGGEESFETIRARCLQPSPPPSKHTRLWKRSSWPLTMAWS